MTFNLMNMKINAQCVNNILRQKNVVLQTVSIHMLVLSFKKVSHHKNSVKKIGLQ